ncbi:membrane dipeptidase [Faecalibacterium sp. DFI.5.82]|uniref:membrane dipeptidase n=1 Tax=Faecalibacterium sp. DFI.5.82 TaxID=3031725 RepID=UPI003182D537
MGLGSDFDGIGGKLELSDSSKMPLLADALRKEGFTEDEVEAIFFRNAQRIFENNL